jgi:pyruvate dehydrogenase E2 component (dihydrolipoamide acetyltransferase)
MAIEIVMPRLGWTMEEGIFGEWLKQDGEEVKSGDLLFTVESDKATQEVETFDNGILRIPPDGPKAGDVIPVGGRMGFIVQPGEAAPFETGTQAPAQQPANGGSAVPQPSVPSKPVAAPMVSGNRRRILPTISPRARRVAAELDVEWAQLTGSGRTGRIVERDIRAALAQQAPAQTPLAPPAPDTSAAAPITATPTIVQVSPVAQRMAEAAGLDLAEVAAQKPGQRIQRQDVEAAIAARDSRPTPETSPEADAAPVPAIITTNGETIPVSRIRGLIAQRMAESAHTTAPVTLTTEADASDFVALREQLKASFMPRNLPVPSYNDLLIKLSAVALQEHRLLNASWRGQEIFIPSSINIGLAVDTEEGLVVPVVRAVENKSVRQIATESRTLIEKVQAHKIAPAEMQDATFTITNLGAYQIDAFTPIIPPAQCAILGVGRITKKPAVYQDQVVPRHRVALSLTFDHRIVDGGPAARFLNTIRTYVEEPALWLTA